VNLQETAHMLSACWIATTGAKQCWIIWAMFVTPNIKWPTWSSSMIPHSGLITSLLGKCALRWSAVQFRQWAFLFSPAAPFLLFSLFLSREGLRASGAQHLRASFWLECGPVGESISSRHQDSDDSWAQLCWPCSFGSVRSPLVQLAKSSSNSKSFSSHLFSLNLC
jgi:hypothetical protein